MSDLLRVLRDGEGPAAPADGTDGEAGEPTAAAAPAVAPARDLATVRERLAELAGESIGGGDGRHVWRSLEQVADSDEFREMLYREFPRQASEWVGGEVSRRRFLQLGSASLALGGLAGCVRQPSEKIVPYVRQPEEVVPGNPLYFASTAAPAGHPIGVLVESHLGRPTKIEGNPDHPASLGATDLFTQASILDLYDPDRLQAPSHLGRPRPWTAFTAALDGAMQAQRALGGAGLRIVTGAVTSPTLEAQLTGLLADYPEARWLVWEPAAGHAVAPGGGAVRYDLGRADVVVTLDSDFLTQGPGAVRYARDWTARRRAGSPAWPGDGSAEGGGATAMPRLYAVESSPTATGSMADHRLALPPSEVARFATALAAALGAGGGAAAEPFSRPQAALWVHEVARDLERAGAGGLVVAGDYAPPAVHALARAINRRLGSAAALDGPPAAAVPPGDADPVAALADLAREMAAGAVDLLVVLGANPAFTAPADLDFAAAMARVPMRVYLGADANETADSSQWLIPEAHWLEGWSDARAFDGTASIVQPLIEPLYPGARTAHELVAALAGRPDANAYDLVREHWRRRGLGGGGEDFEAAWRRAVHDGVIAGPAAAAGGATASGSETVPAATATTADATPQVADVGAAPAPAAPAAPPEPAPEGMLELVFRPDPTLWDGRFANNAWLQECPKPLTKLTWDNPLLVSPATAERLGVASTDRVRVTVGERSLEVPVWVQPGHADRSATLYLGYGRRRVGRVGRDTGFDAYRLRTTAGMWSVAAAVEPIGGSYALACTQDHFGMEGRHQVRVGTAESFRDEPEFARHMEHVPGPEVSMFPDYDYPGYAWGMAVDLAACTGCNACVVACQAENNIPTVGKQQVLNAREMHWIRIDRYFEGPVDDPVTHNQPVMCQQCERAPCELVCPVAATVHSSEGLNDMVYNRCVGTRYCSNNCPYKVRRFNFLQWVDTETEVLKMVRNPDVTVRDRGVMEKCTYCVQRINFARAEAKRSGRKIRDGEAVTACQQVCPADAIRFGDLNDGEAEVVRWKALPLDYPLLGVLNTRPRTSYLAKLTNPNPALGRS